MLENFAKLIEIHQQFQKAQFKYVHPEQHKYKENHTYLYHSPNAESQI